MKVCIKSYLFLFNTDKYKIALILSDKFNQLMNGYALASQTANLIIITCRVIKPKGFYKTQGSVRVLRTLSANKKEFIGSRGKYVKKYFASVTKPCLCQVTIFS